MTDLQINLHHRTLSLFNKGNLFLPVVAMKDDFTSRVSNGKEKYIHNQPEPRLEILFSMITSEIKNNLTMTETNFLFLFCLFFNENIECDFPYYSIVTPFPI